MSALRKVLVVDDDPIIGKSFTRVLSGKGFAVITAADGEEALKKLSAETYDVVFTDIKMPGMSGIEVAKRLKATQPWLPVVIVTAYGSEENEVRANEAGVSGFLRKPLTPEMIMGAASATFIEPKPEPTVATVALVETIEAPKVSIAETDAVSVVKNVALFFAAPFIGLIYFMLFPFVGLGLLIRAAFRAIRKRG